MDGGGDITALLEEWREGSDSAFKLLAPAIADHLHNVAQAFLRGERRGGSLQATELVNELFVRLIQSRRVKYASREHFYTFAAKLMRRILVDQVRKLATQKRGALGARITLVPELMWVDASSVDILALDGALEEFGALYPEKVRTLELRFFLGATAEEAAELLGQTRSRVNRDIDFSLSWLHRRMKAASRTGQNAVESRQPN